MRRGFTVIELLVILAIIAIGLVLTFPAVQQATQDARRNHCKNNLKQCGLALHNYHEVYNSFPPGWVSRDGAVGLGPRLGWQAAILPMIDQAVLYNQIDFSLTSPMSAEGRPLPIFQTSIESYRCPSDQTPDVNPLRGNFATSNYTGNYGHIPPPRLGGLGMTDLWPGALPAPMMSRGIFARNSSVGIRDIIDGTSFTLLVSERCVTSGAGIWPGVTDNGHEDDALTDASHRARPNAGLMSLSSRHGGGVNYLLCDGSVHFMNDKVDSKPGPDLGVFQKLGTRDDNLPVDLP